MKRFLFGVALCFIAQHTHATDCQLTEKESGMIQRITRDFMVLESLPSSLDPNQFDRDLRSFFPKITVYGTGNPADGYFAVPGNPNVCYYHVDGKFKKRVIQREGYEKFGPIPGLLKEFATRRKRATLFGSLDPNENKDLVDSLIERVPALFELKWYLMNPHIGGADNDTVMTQGIDNFLGKYIRLVELHYPLFFSKDGLVFHTIEIPRHMLGAGKRFTIPHEPERMESLETGWDEFSFLGNQYKETTIPLENAAFKPLETGVNIKAILRSENPPSFLVWTSSFPSMSIRESHLISPNSSYYHLFQGVPGEMKKVLQTGTNPLCTCNEPLGLFQLTSGDWLLYDHHSNTYQLWNGQWLKEKGIESPTEKQLEELTDRTGYRALERLNKLPEFITVDAFRIPGLSSAKPQLISRH